MGRRGEQLKRFGFLALVLGAVLVDWLSIARGVKDPMEQILTSGLDDAVVVEGGSNFLDEPGDTGDGGNDDV